MFFCKIFTKSAIIWSKNTVNTVKLWAGQDGRVLVRADRDLCVCGMQENKIIHGTPAK